MPNASTNTIIGPPNMIKQLKITNFTRFPEAEFRFGGELNLFIGENGTGKSQVLKLAYSLASVLTENEMELAAPTQENLKKSIALKLRQVFRPDTLGRLVRQKPNGARASVSCDFAENSPDLEFSFSKRSQSEVAVSTLPDTWLEKLPVFFPTRELMSIYPNFVSIYETTEGLEIESTWRDTCLLLGALERSGSKEQAARELLQPLEAAMGGSIELERGGRFYLELPNERMEMHLVAEGLRKLAMVARLIATGSLLDKGYLFWDEPEANLNPKIVKQVANTIVNLARNGIQVFVATHSLFLMREIHILLKQSDSALDARFFGFHLKDGGVDVKSGKSMDDVGDVTSLIEDLSQSERYIDLEMGVAPQQPAKDEEQE